MLTDADARRRLEMMLYTYFVNPEHKLTAPFRPALGNKAPPLVDQLARYCLHGTTRAEDVELDGALGRAQPMSDAQRARPWG